MLVVWFDKNMRISAGLYLYILPAVYSVSFSKKHSGFQKHGSIDGRIVAFGDINGDRLVDLFILDDKGKKLEVYNYEKNGFRLIQSVSKDILRQKVVNVLPADLNHDGKLDLIISYEFGSWLEDKTLENHMFINEGNKWTSAIDSPFKTTLSQPFVGDFTGDLQLTILGKSIDNTANSNGLTSWKINGTRIIKSNPVKFFGKQQTPCEISHPHSNAFVDLDGDCLPGYKIINRRLVFDM